jgi:hypothetical protein
VPLSWSPSGGRESESFVTVLADHGGKLVEVGRVGDLGRGERVYAVRFIGDIGYVVTFRQVDPLYTIDLADPTGPAVVGALELRGYSAYLHPIGKDLLLGVGQDATEEGRLQGTKLSLFDVSDPRRPLPLDSVQFGPASSEVEYDQHAFLYWPPSALAVLPVQIFENGGSASAAPFFGAAAFRVTRSGLQELGRITQPTAEPDGVAQVRRALVVGDRLFTVSDRGIKASSLATLADVAWVPFS